jgi:Family of unknown function (DUF6152)
MLTRRNVVLGTTGLFMVGPLTTRPSTALAHHGWSSFDEKAPLLLSGKLKKVQWQNPHVMIWIDVAKDLKVPADFAKRSVPPQVNSVDTAAILAGAKVPNALGLEWEVELAPLSRVQAWQIPELKVGDSVDVVGYTFAGQKGERVLRAEFVFVAAKGYGLRSAPKS